MIVLYKQNNDRQWEKSSLQSTKYISTQIISQNKFFSSFVISNPERGRAWDVGAPNISQHI